MRHFVWRIYYYIYYIMYTRARARKENCDKGAEASTIYCICLKMAFFELKTLKKWQKQLFLNFLKKF